MLLVPRRCAAPTPTWSRGFSTNHRTWNVVKPFDIAIVGSGPAGFYTAHHLLHKAPSNIRLNIDFFERLPAPYGLSRYGVAPDHPEVKNCEEYLDNLMDDFGKANEAGHTVRFYGNVNIGRDLTLTQLQLRYHSVVLSYGCTSSDNQLNVPGGDLPGVISARQFVNWYNGHPDSYNAASPFKPPPLDKVETVTIIGNGNVAIDVARVLLAEPGSHWAKTDIADDALQALRTSAVKHVRIVARRGLLESAFSNKEIRELLELSKENNVAFEPLEEKVWEQVGPFRKGLGRIEKRRLALLEKHSKQSVDPLGASPKTWSLGYLLSPVEFIQSPEHPQLLQSTTFAVNEMVGDTHVVQRSKSPNVSVKNELVVLSIGYKGSPLEGFEDVGLVFDEHANRLKHENGRVWGPTGTIPGWYTSGWIKSGPKGVIATTMVESFDTAERVLEDLTEDVHMNPNSREDTESLLGNCQFVSWDSWKQIDGAERGIGMKEGRDRRKFHSLLEMLEHCK